MSLPVARSRASPLWSRRRSVNICQSLGACRARVATRICYSCYIVRGRCYRARSACYIVLFVEGSILRQQPGGRDAPGAGADFLDRDRARLNTPVDGVAGDAKLFGDLRDSQKQCHLANSLRGIGTGHRGLLQPHQVALELHQALDHLGNRAGHVAHAFVVHVALLGRELA